MPNSQQIDWTDLRKGYNRIYHTNYRTVKIFLTKVYKINPSVHKVGEILGLSHTAILYKMMDLNIPRQPKGHRGKTIFQERYRAIKHPGTLKYSEIAKIVGCSNSYAYHLKKIIKKWDEKRIANAN